MAWKDGFRVVDLCELAKQMYCKQCRSILDLNRTGEERHVGFASMLTIACLCGADNSVHTAQRQRANSGETVYAINVKAAIGNVTFTVIIQLFKERGGGRGGGTSISISNTIAEHNFYKRM